MKNSFYIVAIIALVIIILVLFTTKEREVDFDFITEERVTDFDESYNNDNYLRYWIPVTEYGFYNKSDFCRHLINEKARRIISSDNSDYIICFGCKLIKITYRLIDRFGFTNGKRPYYYGRAYLDGECDEGLVYIYRLHKNCIEKDIHTENGISSVWVRGNCWVEN